MTTSLPRKAWHEYRLGKVTIISGASLDRSEEIVDNLRRFQVVAREITTADVVEPSVPTTIYVFPDLYSYQAVTGDHDTSGRFIRRVGANTIVMQGTEGSGGEQVLLHEYTHLIIGSDEHHQYPAWYNEGLAEVLSTIRFHPRTVEVGLIRHEGDSDAFDYSRWLPLEQLFREDYRLISNKRTNHRFYAQSWLLVHYAMFGSLEGRPDRGPQVEQLLAAIADGKHPVTAATESFGGELDGIEAELRDYVRDGAVPFVSFPADQFAWETHRVTPRKVPPPHVGAHLARIAALRGQRDVAVRLAAEARAAKENSVELELALAESTPAEDLEATNYHFENAWRLEPNNVEVLLSYATWLLAIATQSPERYAKQYKARALKLGRDAVAANPDSAGGHFVVGYALHALGDAQMQKAVASLSTAHRLAPADDAIALELGLALADAGEPSRARPLLLRVAKRLGDHPWGAQARHALAVLDARGTESPPR